MEENKKILLPSKRYKKADSEDVDVRLNFETSESLMRIGDKDIVLDLDELFYKERNNSSTYKIFGKMKMVFRNMYSGNTEYTYLKDRLYLVGDGTDNDHTGFIPYDEFAFMRQDVVRQYNAISSGTTLTGYTHAYQVVGPTGHTIVTPIQAPYQNWNVYLSYVYSANTQYSMIYTLSGETKTEGNNIIHFKAEDGIPFRLTYSGDSYYELTSPIEHGMNAGEYVKLSGTTLTGNTFYINSVGNEFYNSEKYVINIAKSSVSGTPFNGMKLMVGKRIIDINNLSGSTSSYYVHLHKTLTNENGYILDKVGFESPIWENERKLVFENFSGKNDILVERNRPESVLFDFKEPFVLSGLTNNLGYTPTDVYVTTIFRNGEGYFDYPPKVGYKFNFHNTWIDEHFSGTGSTENNIPTGVTFNSRTNEAGYTGFTFTPGNAIPSGTTLTGALVEYNPMELKERIVSESFHKFTIPTSHFNHEQISGTTFSGASINNPVGLYYQPHHRIKLRQLSPYVESSQTNDVYNLPENVTYDSVEKIWRWRDLYDHGYVDVDGYGTNFPFSNNMHYVRADINFYLRNEQQYNNKQDGLNGFNFDC
jgi:hypothetical protein